ncbi:MAG: hypothetical protein KDK39_17660 [Leptospiraceae bacterium]|nr:hypothetical protein [Leptospiraceae bacterium]
MADTQVQALNQILAIIDEKATLLKDERYDMPAARRGPERDLILKLIDDALDLGYKIDPRPDAVIEDLYKLQSQLKAII